MIRTGQYFDVTLKAAHLNWGTEGESRATNRRNSFEVYLPISMDNARTFDITTGEVFSCASSDGYYEGMLKATGTQGQPRIFAKNFHKDGDLRALGYWLKDRKKVQVGDQVRVEFTSENSIILHFLKQS